MNGPTGQTAGPIFTHDGSFDAELPKDVPFGGLDDIGPHLGGQAPKNIQNMEVNRVFRQNRPFAAVTAPQKWYIE